MYDCLNFKEGTTPLILAAANNHLDCVKELLKQGADPNSRRLVGFVFMLFVVCGFILIMQYM